MEEEKLTAGQEAVKWLKPGGCVLVILLTVVAMFLLMTSGRDPIDGYEPPETMEYYAQNPAALARELTDNVLPHFDGAESCAVGADGRVTVTLTGKSYAADRAAILRYFDAELIEFVMPNE